LRICTAKVPVELATDSRRDGSDEFAACTNAAARADDGARNLSAYPATRLSWSRARRDEMNQHTASSRPDPDDATASAGLPAVLSGRAPQRYEVRPVAWVESPLRHREQAPRQGSLGAPPAWLDVEPDVAEGIRDLRAGEQVIVLTWLDRARRDELETVPGDNPASPPLGVFSTRSPDRPNPIGLHRVKILAVDGLRILVSELEALDGTPVIDIKPVIDPVAER